MRILNRKDFMACPKGTVYMDFSPCVFGQLTLKTSGPENEGDFYVSSLEGYLSEHGASESCGGSEEWFALVERAEKGERVDVHYDTGGREGMFNDHALFAVLDRDDVDRLIAVLQAAQKGLPDWT